LGCPALFGHQRPGRAERAEATAPQRFTHIYIAEPCDKLLIEQGRLQGRFPVPEQPRQSFAAQIISERFKSQVPEKGVVDQIHARNEIHKAEPARIVVDNACPRAVSRFQMKDHMIVLCIPVPGVLEVARCFVRHVILDPERP